MLAKEAPDCIPVKSMFLCSKNRFIFLTMPAGERLDMAELAKFTGISRPPFRILRSEKYEEVFGFRANHVSIIEALESRSQSKVPFQFLFDSSFDTKASSLQIACLNRDGTGSLLLEMDTILQKVAEIDTMNAKKCFFLAAGASAVKSVEGDKLIQQGDSMLKDLSISSSYSKLGIGARKEENFYSWYTEVIKKAELIEYYDVSGCYILRPWGYSIWENIQYWFDSEIKKMGVQNCYFPILITKAALQREESHLDGFAPEVAWITKNGDCSLSDPIAVRPTSETAMYPAYAKWIRSHRDLPLKLNQWSNVLRWEFSHPTPFIRSREFLWQEGHTAWETAEEAKGEALQILGLYADVYQHLLAVPVIQGKKTEKERFPGADITWSIEAFITQGGRGCQAATSHFLGQNFAKMFEIEFENQNKERKYVWQNSWGFTTRSIGIMIMTHSDNKGLVLPPRVAQVQIIILPCGIKSSTTPEEKAAIISALDAVNKELCAAGVRSQVDARENVSVGWKFNHWELKGVPLRLELGPKELCADKLKVTCRYNGMKKEIKRATMASDISLLLSSIHDNMLADATHRMTNSIQLVKSWTDFRAILAHNGFPQAAFCGDKCCEESIKAQSAVPSRGGATEANSSVMGAKSLCIPIKQPDLPLTQCINEMCENTPTSFTIFGRSY